MSLTLEKPTHCKTLTIYIPTPSFFSRCLKLVTSSFHLHIIPKCVRGLVDISNVSMQDFNYFSSNLPLQVLLIKAGTLELGRKQASCTH
jgi:hypothetical protein